MGLYPDLREASGASAALHPPRPLETLGSSSSPLCVPPAEWTGSETRNPQSGEPHAAPAGQCGVEISPASAPQKKPKRFASCSKSAVAAGVVVLLLCASAILVYLLVFQGASASSDNEQAPASVQTTSAVETSEFWGDTDSGDDVFSSTSGTFTTELNRISSSVMQTITTPQPTSATTTTTFLTTTQTFTTSLSPTTPPPPTCNEDVCSSFNKIMLLSGGKCVDSVCVCSFPQIFGGKDCSEPLRDFFSSAALVNMFTWLERAYSQSPAQNSESRLRTLPELNSNLMAELNLTGLPFDPKWLLVAASDTDGDGLLGWEEYALSLVIAAANGSEPHGCFVNQTVPGSIPYLFWNQLEVFANSTLRAGSLPATDVDAWTSFMGIGLDPYAFDTDMDLLSDGFETLFSTDGCVENDLAVDHDGDGLSLVEEYRLQSDPFDSNSPPSDHDAESPSNDTGTRRFHQHPRCYVEVTIGDWSGSESERWDLILRADAASYPSAGMYLFPAPSYGQVETWRSWLWFGTYSGRLVHRGTNLDSPDYDWTASVRCVSPACQCSAVGDLQGTRSDDALWAQRSLVVSIGRECDLACINGGRCTAALDNLQQWSARCECPRGFCGGLCERVETAAKVYEPDLNEDQCGSVGSEWVPDSFLSLVDFSRHCAAHDVCYTECGGSARSQSECDEELTERMKAECFTLLIGATYVNEIPWLLSLIGHCVIQAVAYGAALAAFGETAYKNAKSEFCQCS